jgi:hypothetical protein
VLTKKPAGRKLSCSLFSNLLRRSIVAEETLHPQLLQELLDSAGQFKRILEDSDFIQLRRLTDKELLSRKGKAGIIEKYCFLSENDIAVVKDIPFKEGINVGNQSCQPYTMANSDHL